MNELQEHMYEQKYRPTKLADCILPEQDRKTFEGMIKSGRIGHTLLISKTPGTGKTTMARVLVNEIDAELYFLNGSSCTVDKVNDLIKFASTKTTKPGGKVIIIDEFDRKRLQDSQLLMRGFMEEYSHNCSVIITANNASGIIEAIKSRCTIVEFGRPTKEDKPRMMIEMIKRLIMICEQENVLIDGDEGKKSIAALVKKQFPDLRSCVTTLNRYAKTGKIDAGMLALETAAVKDLDELVAAMRNKKFSAFRALVPNFAYDYPSFIKSFYNRMFTEVDSKSLPILIDAIGRNSRDYESCADIEIHITWLLTEIMLEVAWK